MLGSASLQGAIAMDSRPLVGVEVGRDGDDGYRFRHVRRHQPGDGAASTIANEHDAAKRVRATGSFAMPQPCS